MAGHQSVCIGSNLAKVAEYRSLICPIRGLAGRRTRRVVDDRESDPGLCAPLCAEARMFASIKISGRLKVRIIVRLQAQAMVTIGGRLAKSTTKHND